jgi:hypothetical protein
MKKMTYGMRVEGFTVSFSFEKYQGGEKMSSFVAMNFKLDEPLPPGEAQLAEAEASSYVTESVILDALARGIVSMDVAKDMIQAFRTRSEGVRSVIRRSMNEDDSDAGR